MDNQDNLKEKIISLLSHLVSVDTRYIEKNEGLLQEFLTVELEKRGFEVSIVLSDGRPNILADNKKNGKSLLFYGHIDTVDVVTGWSKTPYSLTLENNKAFGLGAYDMKGGIAAILTAIENTTHHIKIFFAVDEENISIGAWDIVTKQKDFFDDVELIVSAEPNFGLGLHGITTARTGRAIFKVISQETPVHVAKWKKGVNAIYPLTRFIQNLKSNLEKVSTDKFSVIQPRSISTQTIGMSVCEKAELHIEALIGSQDSIDSLLKNLQSLAKITSKNLTVSLLSRKTPYLEGYSFESFPLENEISHIIHTHTNNKMKKHSRSSVGDDNVLALLGIPVITWGPDGDGAHEPDEWVDIESLVTLTKMFIDVIH